MQIRGRGGAPVCSGASRKKKKESGGAATEKARRASPWAVKRLFIGLGGNGQIVCGEKNGNGRSKT